MKTEKQKQQLREAVARWRARNPSYGQKYYASNRDREIMRLSEWNNKNPSYRKEINDSRTFRVRNAGSDPRIKQFYLEAKKKTKETGISHVVDHIIPIHGKNISGLHVPWNLQVITQIENREKSNKVLHDHR